MDTKPKRPVGIKILGGLFFFLVIYLAGSAYSVSNKISWDENSKKMQEMVKKTVDGLKAYEKEEYQQKLKQSGNLEKFNQEREFFEKKMMQFPEVYKQKVERQNTFIFIVSCIACILCFFAGVALIFSLSWARKISFLGLLGLSIHHVLILQAIYPVLAIVQFIVDEGNKLNLLVDPAYTNFSREAGRPAFMLLLSYPAMVLLNILVLIIVAGSLYYLSRPKVKESLEIRR